MKLLPVLILNVLAIGDELSAELDDPSVYDSAYDVMSFKTAVFNGFPDTSVTASVMFKDKRVSRLRYGQLRSTDVSMTPYDDFIIQFRQAPTDGELELAVYILVKGQYSLL